MSIKERLLQKKNLWHVGAVALFFIVTSVYFYPTFQNYAVDSGDVKNFVGMSQEIKDYRQNSDEQILWTSSMFSGMPATQISVKYGGREIPGFFRDMSRLWLPHPAGTLFACFIGFYILAMSLRLKPLIGGLGGLAYGLSSYSIILVEAGHNSKFTAIAYMPFVVAGFIMSYRRKNMLLGLSLSALFMTFELMSNHFQITYYLAFILIALGIYELVRAFQEQKIPRFIKVSAGLFLAYGLALAVNIGLIWGTMEYTKHTTRGGADIAAVEDSTNTRLSEGGLDPEYITAWSYGKAETFTLLVPNFKGGETQLLGQNEDLEHIVKDTDPKYRQGIKQSNQYWGDQPFTSGPVYLGAIVMLLAILGLFYCTDRLKWPLLIVTVLAILLSWGKNFMGLTDFFINVVPGYDKFRTVSMILVIAQLCVPLLGVLFLHRLFKERERIAQNIKPFFIITGSVLGLLLLFAALPTMFNTFISDRETEMLAGIADPNQLTAYEEFFAELKNVRISIFRSDVFRSFTFVLLGAAVLFLFIKGITQQLVTGIALILLVLADLATIDTRYFNNEKTGKNYEHWIEPYKRFMPYQTGPAEQAILSNEIKENPELLAVIDSVTAVANEYFKENDIKGEESLLYQDWLTFRALNRNTHFRVFEQGNPFNSSYTSYFNKSVGGYHGAKLGRYQELIEYQLSNFNPAVINMLNVKYFVSPNIDQTGINRSQLTKVNESALGNTWFVEEVKVVNGPKAEMDALNSYKTYEMVPLSVTPVMVNGQKIDSKTILEGTEKVSFVNMGVTQDLSLNMDTVEIPIPYQQMKDEDHLCLIKQDSLGLTWAYANMVDSTFNRILTVKVNNTSGFDPEEHVVVDKEFARNFSQDKYSGEGTIELVSYHPEKLVYNSKSPEKQLAVFSEIYYPVGWKAYIDGKEVPISRVNYVLRAIEVPEGEHEIRFEYELSSYQKSKSIAWAASIVILLTLIGGIYLSFKSKDSDSNSDREVSVEEEDD